MLSLSRRGCIATWKLTAAKRQTRQRRRLSEVSHERHRACLRSEGTGLEEALAGQAVEIGSGAVKPGTLRALAVSYFASPAFRTKRPSTQYTYRNVIERLCVEHGDKRTALL